MGPKLQEKGRVKRSVSNGGQARLVAAAGVCWASSPPTGLVREGATKVPLLYALLRRLSIVQRKVRTHLCSVLLAALDMFEGAKSIGAGAGTIASAGAVESVGHAG